MGLAEIVGEPEVDQAVDCVGFEARGHGKDAAIEQPATVLNSVMEVTRAGGGMSGLLCAVKAGGNHFIHGIASERVIQEVDHVVVVHVSTVDPSHPRRNDIPTLPESERWWRRRAPST